MNAFSMSQFSRTYSVTSSFAMLWMMLLLIPGCGGPEGGEVLSTVTASGSLNVKGQPLEFHQVVLSAEGKRSAVGISGKDGRFVLGTNKEGDGAPPGDYSVTVLYVGPPSTNPNDGINEFTTPPPPKFKINRKYNDPKVSGLSATVPTSGTSDLKFDLQ
jgi:hypothetical protein